MIYTTHGFYFHKHSSKKTWIVFHTIEDMMSRYCDAIITINREDYGNAKKLHCGKVFYIPGVGVDTKRFRDVDIDRSAYRKMLGIRDNQLLVLAVGELSHRKNHQIVVKALAKAQIPDAVFMICGNAMTSANTKEELEQLAKEVGIDLRLMGLRDDIPQICKCADIGVMPSTREGLGLSGIEMLAAGLPVIASNVHGIVDYISGIMIYPSLDLGFPNNVQRLAGGFATGMLVTWKCGTAIIPVDATVNVCSSSVYRINDFPEMSDQEFEKYIDSIVMKATKEKGYSFSFDNGNHFIMIAQSLDDKALYVVMHSSVKEFKDSYMGLYPVEENWFSDSIRTYHDNGRYLRYIKDEDARQFAAYAHKLEQYNVQIHKWYAEQIGIQGDAFIKKNTFHHYYMPNDSTIAIGTFVEKPGTILPIFSSVGKDIYLFKVSDENWKIRINGEERCLVPHGWGQVIDNVRSISSDFKKKQLKIDREIYKVHSKSRITEGKHIRDFQDGAEFFERGKKMLKGEIVKTLRPLYLYCNTKKGKVNDREA